MRDGVPATRWNRSNTRGSSVSDADAGIPDRELDHLIALPQLEVDRSAQRELERVGEEIEDDLLPHVAVEEQRPVDRFAVDDELQAALSIAERNADASSRVSVVTSVGATPARAPASMREKSSSEFTSFSSRPALRCRISTCAACASLSAPCAVEQVFRRTEHQRQRRSELVADVAEERRLDAIEFGQRLGLAPRLLQGDGVADSGGDVIGGGSKKSRYRSSSARAG